MQVPSTSVTLINCSFFPGLHLNVCTLLNCVWVGLYLTEESKIVRELAEINHRYEALRTTLTDREEDLDINSKLAEKTKNVGGLMEWVTATDAKVVSAAPRGADAGQLASELDTYKVRTQSSCNAPSLNMLCFWFQLLKCNTGNHLQSQTYGRLNSGTNARKRSHVDNIYEASTCA